MTSSLLLFLLLPAILLLGFLIYVARRPSDFEVVRSAEFDAPPARVFGKVNDLREFQSWSPWAEMDPAAKVDFAGPPQGEGTEMRWDGNGKVGAGAMILMESVPTSRIVFRLEFYRPFKATNVAQFDFVPTAQGTQVRWSMRGKANFVAKLMGVFMNCDKMCGDQFEWGFRNLRKRLESETQSVPAVEEA